VPITRTGAYQALAPQAFAETAPQFYSSYFVPRLGIPLETAFASYGQLYRSQIWLKAAVDKVSNSIARLPLNVWDDHDGGKAIDVDSPYAELMAKPCVTMSTFAFKRWIAAMIEIYGEAFLLKIRAGRGNQITSLLPMHPSMTNIKRDEHGELLYQFLGRPNEVFTEGDVVPFLLFNPDNTMRGLSRVEGLRSTLMAEDSARREMQAWYQNRMRPSMLLRAKRELGKEGRERVSNALSARHGGSGNTGRVMVLENDEFEEPTLLQTSAVDMQYVELRQLAREEVAAGMDIPPTALQDMTRATFANVVENLRSLYRESITPRAEFMESVLREYVGNEFYGPKVAKFDMRAVLRGDWEKRAGAHAQLIQSAAEMPAEAREDLDLPDAGPLSHKLYAQQQIQPLGTLPARPGTGGGSPQPSGGGSSSTPPPAQASALTGQNVSAKDYVRSIGGLLGRGRTLQEAANEMVRKTGDRDGVKAAFEYLMGREL
jgi:HK97 family phage portal protein